MLKEVNCPVCDNKTKIVKNWKFLDLYVTHFKCSCGVYFTQYKGNNLKKYFKNVNKNDIFITDSNNKLQKITKTKTKI